VVASEPGDDEPGWTEVPDGSVVTATPQQVSVAELAAPDIHANSHANSHANQNQKTEDGRIALR
jgi:hypothetical protein